MSTNDWWLASPPPPFAPPALALRRLYEATGGERWVRSDGWMHGPNPCEPRWLNVFCADGLPVYVFLPSNGLSGTIPSEIGLMHSSSTAAGMVGLNLRGNHISGTLPTELGTLSAVGSVSLRLEYNRLSGTVPSELGNMLAERVFCYFSSDEHPTNSFANCHSLPLAVVHRCMTGALECSTYHPREQGEGPSPPAPRPGALLGPCPSPSPPPPPAPPPPCSFLLTQASTSSQTYSSSALTNTNSI